MPHARSLLPVDARLNGICFSANIAGVSDADDDEEEEEEDVLTPVLVSSSNRYTMSPVLVAMGMP